MSSNLGWIVDFEIDLPMILDEMVRLKMITALQSVKFQYEILKGKKVSEVIQEINLLLNNNNHGKENSKEGK